MPDCRTCGREITAPAEMSFLDCPECRARTPAPRDWASCEEHDGECNWNGPMVDLRRDRHGVTRCPSCGSTAILENITRPTSRPDVASAVLDTQRATETIVVNAVAAWLERIADIVRGTQNETMHRDLADEVRAGAWKETPK